MMQELTDAGNFLREALNRYHTACSGIQSYFAQGNLTGGALETFSNRLTNELELVTSFEAKIRLSKVVVSNCRNYYTNLAPINTFPPELLARVFHFARDAQDCNPRDKFVFPPCPDNLSHVCSNWRQITLHSRALWAHIDLAPCHPLGRGLLDRAAAYVARSGELPVHIHAMHTGEPGIYTNRSQEGMRHFLASAAARIGSLELAAEYDASSDYPEGTTGDITTLQLCIDNCVPGVLTQLSIRNQFTLPNTFILPGDVETDVGEAVTIDSHSTETLDDLWRPITVLRLRGMYPYWTSEAYHGLVELRLIFDSSHDIALSESQLVAILNSSPQLRIFQINSVPNDSLPLDTSTVPVRLNDLEIVDLRGRDNDGTGVGRLLRWIAPGANPLQLSLTGSASMAGCLQDTAKAFFRSLKPTEASLSRHTPLPMGYELRT